MQIERYATISSQGCVLSFRRRRACNVVYIICIYIRYYYYYYYYNHIRSVESVFRLNARTRLLRYTMINDIIARPIVNRVVVRALFDYDTCFVLFTKKKPL